LEGETDASSCGLLCLASISKPELVRTLDI